MIGVCLYVPADTESRMNPVLNAPPYKASPEAAALHKRLLTEGRRLIRDEQTIRPAVASLEVYEVAQVVALVRNPHRVMEKPLILKEQTSL